ncbi:hypothetical protein, partial [Cypionkella sp.]
MTDHLTSLRLSRRSLLAGSAALTIASFSGVSAFAQAPAGGDIVFLINSLGDTWIPNNSAISSFQG